MDSYVVYCHVSPSGKKYVGISLNYMKRWNSGRGYEKNYRFMRAIEKYGWDSFQHLIVAEGLSADEAKQLEIRLIKEWNLTDFSYGYNLREGGDGPFSEASRTLMSKSRMGNTNTKGQVLSDETKSKISKSLSEYYSTHPSPMLGRHHNAETIAKLKARGISDATRKRMRDNHADVSGVNNPSAKPIVQKTLDGQVIAEYPYATIAAEKYGIDLSSIIKCCRGKMKTCGGYRWAYK